MQSISNNNVAELFLPEVISMISSKWKISIIYNLKNGPLRFNQLRKQMGGVTQRVLTKQLRELEVDGIINREVFAQVPPRVDYSLTEFGFSFVQVLEHLDTWAVQNFSKLR